MSRPVIRSLTACERFKIATGCALVGAIFGGVLDAVGAIIIAANHHGRATLSGDPQGSYYSYPVGAFAGLGFVFGLRAGETIAAAFYSPPAEQTASLIRNDYGATATSPES